MRGFQTRSKSGADHENEWFVDSAYLLIFKIKPVRTLLKETTGGEFRVYRASIRLP